MEPEEGNEGHEEKRTAGQIVIDIVMTIIVLALTVLAAALLAASWFVIIGAKILGTIF